MSKQCDPAKEARWRRIVAQWRRSGLTIRAFCGDHDLPESSFHAWRRTLAQREAARHAGTSRQAGADKSSLFVPVRLASEPSHVPITAVPALEVLSNGGRVVRVRPGFDPATLRQLLDLLEAPSC